MAEKLEIALCMGSSCFARGNNALLDTLENLIKARGWEDRVSLSGLRCEGRCNDGPNLKIDGTLYHGMDEGALLDLLESRLGTPAGVRRPTVRLSSVRRNVGRKGS